MQVVELRAALATEQTAHRRAVQQYVDALDAKSDMQLQLEASQQALSDLAAAHTALTQTHQQLQQQYDGLLGQCRVVRDVCRHVDEALGLDPQLVQQVQSWQAANTPPIIEPSSSEQQAVAQSSEPLAEKQQPLQQHLAQLGAQPAGQLSTQGEQPVSSSSDSSNSGRGCSDGATDLQPLAERLEQQVQAMYASWRSASNARDVALTERFQMADHLRDAEEAAWQMQQQHKALQQVLQEVQQQLAASQVGRRGGLVARGRLKPANHLFNRAASSCPPARLPSKLQVIAGVSLISCVMPLPLRACRRHVPTSASASQGPTSHWHRRS